GRITEVRGYLMHGLTVTARNNHTGQQFETRTDDKGFFLFAHLEAGSYGLRSECPNIQEIVGHSQVVAGKTAEVELLALPVQPTGNSAIDKFNASSSAYGGRYPAGNLSYLN